MSFMGTIASVAQAAYSAVAPHTLKWYSKNATSESFRDLINFDEDGYTIDSQIYELTEFSGASGRNGLSPGTHSIDLNEINDLYTYGSSYSGIELPDTDGEVVPSSSFFTNTETIPNYLMIKISGMLSASGSFTDTDYNLNDSTKGIYISDDSFTDWSASYSSYDFDAGSGTTVDPWGVVPSIVEKGSSVSHPYIRGDSLGKEVWLKLTFPPMVIGILGQPPGFIGWRLPSDGDSVTIKIQGEAIGDGGRTTSNALTYTFTFDE